MTSAASDRERPLQGQVAVVAGATRGAGRGIARMLGEAGARVYCTGRSTRGGSGGMAGRPETIDETAELIEAAGGQATAVRVDHTQEDQVVALAARVREEAGRLDILVNDIWGGDSLTNWEESFWQVDLSNLQPLISGRGTARSTAIRRTATRRGRCSSAWASRMWVPAWGPRRGRSGDLSPEDEPWEREPPTISRATSQA